MRKLFTLIATALMTVAASATDYTGKLNVQVYGESIVSETTINVSPKDESAGTYTLTLKNFNLAMGDDVMNVGTIVLDDVQGTTVGSSVKLSTNQKIMIQNGDDPSVDTWLGPMLGEVPIAMNGIITGSDFYTVININMANLGIVVKVIFGENPFQIKNSGFEDFHTETFGSNSAQEPNNWHSFMSCTGQWAQYTTSDAHTFESDDVRPGTTGSKSLLLKSTRVFGMVTANGTITTGRIQAGSMSAKDTKNCSFLDLSKTDVDGNGDPFYATLEAQPDSIAMWVKFHQGPLKSSDKNYVYATASAIITDGTYYQDPSDKDYTNIVAKAKNAEIASNGEVWQRISIPFDYASYAANNAETKAILVTISTNAQPGAGSNSASDPDCLYIDDLSLVYNAQLEGLKLSGADVEGFSKDTYEYDLQSTNAIGVNDIEAVADGRQAIVTKAIEETEDGVKATISVTSADYATTNTYVLNIKGATPTGVSKVEVSNNAAAQVYNINGQRVSSTAQKGLYIVRTADGKTVKVLKK